MKVNNVRLRTVYKTGEQPDVDSFELIIDFDNDRHHLVNIPQGVTEEGVARILTIFAMQIDMDEHA